MNYTSFCETLYSEVSKKAEGHFVVRREHIPKNNGVVHEAIGIHPLGHRCSSVVCLEPLYQLYLSGAAMEAICASVLSCLEEALHFSPELLPDPKNLEQTGAMVAYRLISQKDNELLLQDVPWVPFLDLAIVFFLVLKNDSRRQVTALLHNQHAECLGLSAEDLRALAQRNTPSLYPPSLCPLEELLFGPKTFGREAQSPSPAQNDAEDSFIFVLTNESGINGAACLLYDNIIKDFADQMAADVLILPSSVHEVLLIPDFHTLDYQEYRQMVCYINRAEVPKEDRLSDEIYLYSRTEQALTVWSPPFSRRTPRKGGKKSP